MARPRQISDEQIAEAARACFLEHGPGVSVAVVAERLGVTQPALFRRMRSKEELLLAAVSPGPPPQSLSLLDEAPDPDVPLPEQLERVLLDLHAFFRRLVPGLMVLKASGLGLEKVFPPQRGKPPPPLRTRRALAAWLERAADAGRLRTDDAEAVANLLLSALESRCFLEHISDGRFTRGSDSAFVRRLVASTWKGLA